jgi:hypothetical protein
MGVRGSTLIGKAQPDERLLHFTSWDMAGIIALKERHAHDLGHQFALGVKQVRIFFYFSHAIVSQPFAPC